jgi:hypothetical protein
LPGSLKVLPTRTRSFEIHPIAIITPGEEKVTKEIEKKLLSASPPPGFATKTQRHGKKIKNELRFHQITQSLNP